MTCSFKMLIWHSSKRNRILTCIATKFTYAINLLAETLTFNQNEAAAGSPVIDNFVNQLIQQPNLILDLRIEPSLIGLDAAPPVQMSNHLPSGGVARYSANCVAQSNRVGIVRAPAPHLRALKFIIHINASCSSLA